MIKNFNIKYLPLILLMYVSFSSIDGIAADHFEKVNSSAYIEIGKKDIKNALLTKRKGFIRKSLLKLKENLEDISRKTTHKIKRFFSKRNAKKNKMKSRFRDRKRNLFNILVFSVVFLTITVLLTFLFFSSVISYTFFLISLIITGVSTIVISLIYFSNRYIIKPHYRS